MIVWLILSGIVTLASAEGDGCKIPAQLVGPGGTFSSPYYGYYPGFTYPPYLKCRWSIAVTPGKSIRITLASPMAIKGESLACASDYLAIFPGKRTNVEICESRKKGTIAGPFCPTEEEAVPPSSFVVARDNIDVEFCSDMSGAFAGFSLTYTETEELQTNPIPTPPTIVCGGSVSVRKGTSEYIQSPLYPAEYPADVECVWAITAPEDHFLTFTAEAFDLEDTEECYYDSLLFVDSSLAGDGVLGKFCGSVPLPTRVPLQSVGNRVDVTFYSDFVSEYGGFRIRVEVSPCPVGTGQCQDGSSRVTCFRPNQLCDGKRDCPDGSDEVCPAGCGIPTKKPLLTAGRREVKPHSWPWQALVLGGPSLTLLCGASIIDHHWVMTAGDCCRAYAANPLHYRIQVGEHNLDRSLEARAWTYNIETVIPHPNAPSDICLLKTKQPILFNEDVQPVCLAFGSPHPVGQECYVTGWGSPLPVLPEPEESNLDRHHLRNIANKAEINRISSDVTRQTVSLGQITAKIADRDACHKAYSTEGITLSDDVICTQNTGEASCPGDGGGPLVCPSQPDGDTWELVGIVSARHGCAKAELPGAYTDVFHYMDWIGDIVMSR